MPYWPWARLFSYPAQDQPDLEPHDLRSSPYTKHFGVTLMSNVGWGRPCWMRQTPFIISWSRRIQVEGLNACKAL